MTLEAKLSLRGTIDRDIAALFVEQLAGLSREDAPVMIDLEDADIESGAVAAALVDHLRQAASRVGALVLYRAPQVLAHALYRVGVTGPRAHIQLIEPREELGTTN